MKTRLIALLVGVTIALAWAWYRDRQRADPQPLKVTIIDDGGAHLKVESTVSK